MPKFAILRVNLNSNNVPIPGFGGLPAGTLLREPEIKILEANSILGPYKTNCVIVSDASGKQVGIGENHFLFSNYDEPYFLTDDAFGQTRVISMAAIYVKDNPHDGISVFDSPEKAADAVLSTWCSKGSGLWDVRVRNGQNKIERVLNFNDIVPAKRQYYFVRYQGQDIPIGAYDYGCEMFRTVTGAERVADELNWKHGEVMEIVDRYLRVVKTVGTAHKGVIQQDVEAFGRYMQGSDFDERDYYGKSNDDFEDEDWG